MSWEDKGRAVDVVYLNFSMAFDTVSHNILLGKLGKCRLDERTVRWIENWLNGRAQSVVISSAESGWRPVASGVNILRVGIKRMGPDSFQWCPATGQVATGTN